MFYFQNLFNTAMNGIDAGGATGGVVQVAQYILLAALMFGIFQAWANGGDTQLLGVTGMRFFAMGLILVNYTTVFRDVNGMFNGVANLINTSTAGGGDVFSKWMSDIGSYWQSNGMSSLWGLITGALASLLEAILLLVGYLLFPITYALFSLLYALYGSILYPSERESDKVGILHGFPDSAHGEEFEVADGQSLGLEQQVTQVLVAAPAIDQHADVAVDGFDHTHADFGPAVVGDPV